jgi:hypothetical protein
MDQIICITLYVSAVRRNDNKRKLSLYLLQILEYGSQLKVIKLLYKKAFLAYKGYCMSYLLLFRCIWLLC